MMTANLFVFSCVHKPSFILTHARRVPAALYDVFSFLSVKALSFTKIRCSLFLIALNKPPEHYTLVTSVPSKFTIIIIIIRLVFVVILLVYFMCV